MNNKQINELRFELSVLISNYNPEVYMKGLIKLRNKYDLSNEDLLEHMNYLLNIGDRNETSLQNV